MEFRDQLGRKFILNKTPERIISLVPSQTELLVDLGLRENIVGITSFCVHPEDLLEQITSVGGTKKVNLKKVKSLMPDIILCNKEENTLEMITELEKIAPVHISDISNLSEAYQMIEQYGELFLKSNEAGKIITKIKSKAEKINKPKRKKVVYFIWKKPYMVAGQDTFINAMLELNNFENVIPQARYPKIELKKLPEADLYLLSTEPYPFSEKDKKNFNPSKNRIEIVNGEFFSWYGSRLIKAMDYFAELAFN